MRKILALVLSITLVVTSMTFLGTSLKAADEEAVNETEQVVEETQEEAEVAPVEEPTTEEEEITVEKETSEEGTEEADKEKDEETTEEVTVEEPVVEEEPEEVETVLTTTVENGGGVKVVLYADKGVFPEGCKLNASLVSSTKGESSVSKADVARSDVYDINVTKDGKEIQPDNSKGKCKIVFALNDTPSGSDGIQVYHTSGGSTDVVSHTESLGGLSDEATAAVHNTGASEVVVANANSFSYYTVDFTYNDKVIQLPGAEGGIALTPIIRELGITEDITDIIAYQDEACTTIAEGGVVRDAEGKEIYSLTAGDGEWYINSEVPFETRHGLLVKTSDAEYKVSVTDEGEVTSPTVSIVGYAKRETTGFRKSELLEVVWSGFDSNANISITYTISNEGNARFRFYNSANQFNVTEEDQGSRSTLTLTSEYKYFACDDYGNDETSAKIEVTVTDKNTGASATTSHVGFSDSNLQMDVDNARVIMFVGDSFTANELYALAGVTHITCKNSSTTVSKEGVDTNIVGIDGNTITAKKAGKTTLPVYVKKTTKCCHHTGKDATSNTDIIVVNIPTYRDTGDGEVEVGNLTPGCIYYIGGKSVGPATASDKTLTLPMDPGTYSTYVKYVDGEKVYTKDTSPVTVAGAKQYNITKNVGPKGSITDLSAEKAVKGADVTFKLTPDSNCLLNSYSVTKGTGTDTVSTSYDSDTKTYKFTMPNSDVKINATFLTIVAPTNLEYDGSPKKAKLKVGNDTPTDSDQIKYYKKNSSGGWDEMPSTEYPTYVGDYKATYTKDGQTISTEFSITAKTLDSDNIKSIDAVPYIGAEQKPAVAFKDDAGQDLVLAATDYSVTYSNNINAKDKTATNAPTATVTFKGNYTGTGAMTFTITPATIQVLDIRANDKYYDAKTDATLDYTHTELKAVGYTTAPADIASIGVSATGTFENANAGEDKKVSITNLALLNNTNNNYVLAATGQPTETQASIIAQPVGKDNQTDTKKRATVDPIDDQTYTGLVINPTSLVVKAKDAAGVEHTLVQGTDKDYTVTYETDSDHNNIDVNDPTTDPNGIVHVHFQGNYSGNTDVEFNIVPKEAGDDEKDPAKRAQIAKIDDQTYTGYNITPELTITDPTLPAGSNVLVAGKDYDVTYDNNINVGTATAYITYKGNYSGTTSKTFTINPAKIQVRGIEAQDKPYDSNTSATLVYDRMSLAGISTADTGKLSATAVGTFEDANVGTDKTVNLTSLTLTGEKAGNYILDPTPDCQQKTATADITAQPIGKDNQEDENKRAKITPIPDKTYTGSVINPPDLTIVGIDAAGGEHALTKGTDYELTYVQIGDTKHDNTNVGTEKGVVHVEFKGNYSGKTDVEFNIVSKEAGTDEPDPTKRAQIATVGDQTYTGYDITPVLTITDPDKPSGSNELQKGKDYSVTFTNNHDVGTATANITYTGNYKGSNSITFKIVPQSIQILGIKANDKAYDGNTAATLDYSELTLKYRSDADKDTLSATAVGNFKDANAGKDKTVNLTELALTGTAAKNYTIDTVNSQKTTEADITAQPVGEDEQKDPKKQAEIEDIDKQTYTGEPIHPTGLTITAKDASGAVHNLVEGTDYTLSYETKPGHDNRNVGNKNGIVHVHFQGNFSGNTDVEFDIVHAKIVVSGIEADDKVYDGTIPATINLDNLVLSGIKTSDVGKLTVEVDGEFEDEKVGKDKTVNLKNLELAGTSAKNYALAESGQQATTTADITRRPVGDERPEGFAKADVGKVPDQTYTSQIITPNGDDVVITYVDGNGDTVTLEEGKDYKLTYADDDHNNIDAGTKKGIINIEYIGNFSGTTTVEFNILPKEVGQDAKEEDRAGVDPLNPEKYTSFVITPKGKKVTVKVKDPDGEEILLEEGKDYTLDYTDKKHNNTDAGKENGIVYITFQGNYQGELAALFDITPKNVGDDTDDPSDPESAHKPAVIDPIPDQKYTGKQITPKYPDVVIRDPDTGKILEEGKDYVLEYGENIKPGVGTVIIKFIGNYSGEMTATFNIVKKAGIATGDHNNVLLFAGIGLAAILLAVFLLIARKKED